MSATANLPPEIIELFIKFSLNHPRPLDTGGRTTFKNIRAVCRQWREIGFGTPDLWRALDVTMDTTSTRIIEQWFARGGGDALFSLAVGLYGSLSPQVSDCLTQESLNSLLGTYRWSYLDLELLGPSRDDDGQDFGVYSACKPSYSTLQTFGMDNHAATREEPLCISEDTFPALRDLHITVRWTWAAWDERLAKEMSIVNHRGITSLEITFEDTDRLTHRLSSPETLCQIVAGHNLPVLRELILFRTEYTDDEETYNEPPSLSATSESPPSSQDLIQVNPSVQTVVLRSTGSVRYLRYLSFPSIRLLRLMKMDSPSEANLKSLNGFIERCPPVVLSVEDMLLAASHADTLHKIARLASPALRAINLRDADDVAVMDGADRTLYPHLQNITVLRAPTPVPSPLSGYLLERSKITCKSHPGEPLPTLSLPRSQTNADYRAIVNGSFNLEERSRSDGEMKALPYDIVAHHYSSNTY